MASTGNMVRPVEILMVEDNLDDVELTVEALSHIKLHNNLNVVHDGVKALKFLHKEGKYADAPRPDIILLDLNLPKKDGHEVLAHIKSDKNLKRIPVVVLTTSEAREDLVKAYDRHANCYITKPVDFDQFTKVMKTIKDFWFSVVRLP